MPEDIHRTATVGYQTLPDSSAHAADVLRRAKDAISREEWQTTVDLSLGGILAVGFTPELTEALASAYERSGRDNLARAARLGAKLSDFVPDSGSDSPVTIAGPFDTRPSAVDGYRHAIESATKYLIRLRHTGDPAIGLMLSYIGRRFKLPWTAHHVEVSLARARQDDYLRLLTRFADPNVSSLPPVIRLGRVDRVIVPAMYCDIRPLPNDYFALIFWSTVYGGYDLTHAVLALQWIGDLHCIADETRWLSLRRHQVRRLHDFLARADPVDDLFVESVAMLYYLGEGATVNPAWIDRIARAQQSDGGWRRAGRTPMTNDHTTFLALWTLLEHSRPQSVRTPMIFKRSGYQRTRQPAKP